MFEVAIEPWAAELVLGRDKDWVRPVGVVETSACPTGAARVLQSVCAPQHEVRACDWVLGVRTLHIT